MPSRQLHYISGQGILEFGFVRARQELTLKLPVYGNSDSGWISKQNLLWLFMMTVKSDMGADAAMR